MLEPICVKSISCLGKPIKIGRQRQLKTSCTYPRHSVAPGNPTAAEMGLCHSESRIQAAANRLVWPCRHGNKDTPGPGDVHCFTLERPLPTDTKLELAAAAVELVVHDRNAV